MTMYVGSRRRNSNGGSCRDAKLHDDPGCPILEREHVEVDEATPSELEKNRRCKWCLHRDEPEGHKHVSQQLEEMEPGELFPTEHDDLGGAAT